MSCAVCKKKINIMKGPEEYVIKDHKLYHKTCYDMEGVDDKS